MSVFSVPVTIGVDEEKIAKEVQANVEEQVTNRIITETKKVMFKKRGYYSDKYDDPEPLREMVKEEVKNIVMKRQDEIVEMAATALAEKLARSKAVKEVAADVAKETFGK